ncbi:hypothetical protein [Rhizomonospora bruguierae]|uniref:hypothetical protein n=1 Tax=Rhizomonospora bruguierae TaxID=1581705 RepID=UPI001BCC3063|nr:hypothetical protein [Micromonospora sp. NBRC 107566]
MNQAERGAPGPPAVLPLRPLTLGELLDAAVALLRTAAPALLPLALALAAAEQAVLWPLRRFARAEPPLYLPALHFFEPFLPPLLRYWPLLVAGFALEAGIIALLGGVAGRAAGEAVLGRTGGNPFRLLRLGGAGPALLPVAVVCAVVTGLAALGGPLWALGYALFGLAAPALVLDRVGPLRALGRGAVLAVRDGARAGWIRIAGYLGWLGVRAALGLAGVTVLEVFNVGAADWRYPVAFIAWTLVNTLAYPTLACLDAVLHLETRMRTEGLDIRLARAAARGAVTPAHLAVWR